jgi:hypothetical protein
VAQLHDEHLTTEQLSAFFDKQLSPEEQAVSDAHLSTCQQCQHNLADLRLTVALLRAMPVEQAPRSFVLPARLAPVPEWPARQETTLTPVPQRQGAILYTLRRSVRIVSTLAAVLALLLITSGILPPLRIGGSQTASAPFSTMGRVSAGASKDTTTGQTPNVQVTPGQYPQQGVGAGTKTPTPIETHSPTPTAPAQVNKGSGPPTEQPPPLPPALDPGQPAGRLSLGALLLLLSIIGLIATRRRRSMMN